MILLELLVLAATAACTLLAAAGLAALIYAAVKARKDDQ